MKSLGRHTRAGLPAIASMLVAPMPKCPLCLMALTSTLGVNLSIFSIWLQPIAIALLSVSALVLFVRARRTSVYGPFLLALAAAIAMYVCKFRLDSAIGVQFSAAILFAGSVWSALSARSCANVADCHCSSHLETAGGPHG